MEDILEKSGPTRAVTNVRKRDQVRHVGIEGLELTLEYLDTPPVAERGWDGIARLRAGGILSAELQIDLLLNVLARGGTDSQTPCRKNKDRSDDWGSVGEHGSSRFAITISQFWTCILLVP